MKRRWPHGQGEGYSVDFAFICGWCDTECVVWGEPVVSWWTDKFRLPDTFDCWACDGTNITPAPPWTPAD